MSEISVFAWLLMAALLVDFVSLLPVGMFLVGVGKRPEPIWTNLFIGGVIQFILGMASIILGDVSLGFAILVLGWIFVGVGWMAYREFESTGIGSFLLCTAVIFVIYGIYSFTNGLIDWGIIMLTITTILLFFTGMDYGKLSVKVTGWATIIFAIWAAVLGSAMMFGILVY